MRRQGLAILAFSLALAPPAKADLLRAVRPGVMCASADSLAKLSLPDGSSRTAAPNASPALQAIARAGNCVDFPAGNIVILLTARRNTSVVRSDSLTGDGVLETFIVPNIDYAPYAPPRDEFDDAIRVRCPAKLEEVVVLGATTSGFVQSLPGPLREQIEKGVENECGGAPSCSSNQRAVEVSRHHLVQRWAEFTCRR